MTNTTNYVRLFPWVAALIVIGCAQDTDESTKTSIIDQAQAKDQSDDSAETDRNPKLSLKPPEPVLSKDKFAARFREDYYVDADESEFINIETKSQSEFILENLGHLPMLQGIEFSNYHPQENEFAKLALFSNVRRIEFSECSPVDPGVLSAVPQLEEVVLRRCNNVDWQRFGKLLGTKNLQINVSETAIGKNDLLELAPIPLGALRFSSVKSLTDDDLTILKNFTSLHGVEVINCSGVTDAFIDSLLSNTDLREFGFIGSLSTGQAQKLSEFDQLESILLNTKTELDASWYAAIARNCPKLETLKLYGQKLNKAKCDHIASMLNLKTLIVFSGFQVYDMQSSSASVSKEESGMFANFSQLENLEELKLTGGYQYDASDGAGISSLMNLRTLLLWNARFQEESLKDIGGLSKLTDLDLSGARGLGTVDAQGIGALTSLETLTLFDVSKASGADFSHLKGLGNLKMLRLGKFRNLSDDDMSMAEGMKNLEEIWMEANGQISDKGLAHLKHATRLHSIYMTHMRLNGTGFADWPADHDISMVFIEGTRINDEGFRALSRLKKLKSLSVRMLGFGTTRIDVSHFVNTPSLEDISIIGSYATSKESMQKFKDARPETNIYCPVK